MSIFFITGTSGSGKSTVMELLKAQLPAAQFAVHDFDELGAPADADQAWRITTTRYWVEKAQTYAAHNKSTVICGVTVPSELMQAIKETSLQPFFALLNIDDATIKQRLQARGWPEQLIQDNINWARFLESEVKATEQHTIVDGSDQKPADIAGHIVEWIQSMRIAA